MKNKGIVIEVNENKAKVRFIKESACGGNCASCGGCASKPIEIEIENTLDAKPGDKVEVLSDTSGILFSAFIIYIMPLIVFIAVYLLADMFFKESTALILAVICFFMSFYPVRIYGKRMKTDVKMIAKEN